MGGVWLAGWAALVAAGGWAASARVLRQPPGWPRVLGACVLGWAWVTLGMQVLGTIGLLNRWAIGGWAALGLAAGLARRNAPIPPGRGEWSGSATAALGLMIGSAGLLMAPSLLLPPQVVSDGPIYHLYFAARWWKAGRIFLVPTPFGESAAPYFPANGDLLFSALMAVFGGDRPAHAGQSPGLVLGFLAAIALARRLGASLPGAVIASAWAVSSSALLVFGFEANVDALFVAGYLAAVYFGVRYALDGQRAADLALAGLAAGLAWGTKPTAILFVPPLLALGGGIVWRGQGPWRSKAAHLAALMASALLPSAYWFARNGIITGNPLYPLHLQGFGRVWLRGWFERSAMARSPYYIDVKDLRALAAILLTVIDPRLAPAWVAAWLGAWRWGRPGRPIDRWAWGVTALAGANVATYWLLIPYRTQQRFLFQGLGLAAVPLALAMDRWRWGRWAGVALLAVHLFTGQTWPWPMPPGPRERRWSLSDKVPSAIPAPIGSPIFGVPWRAIASDPSALGVAATLAGLVGGSWASAGLWGRSARAGSIRSRAAALGATLATWSLYVGATGALSGATRAVFPPFADYQRGWSAVERASPPRGLRVAYAGTNLPYYLMAGGLRNEVFYINVDRHRDWLPHDYHRSAPGRGEPPLWPTPRPGWDRLRPEFPAWLANLRARGIDLLVVARRNPDEGPFNPADPEGFPVERVWADSRPDLFEPYYPQAGDPPGRMRVYRVARE